VDPTPPPSTTTEESSASPGGNGAAAGLVEAVAENADHDSVATGEGGFAAEAMAELRKVVWPSRQQVFSESVAVVLMVGLSAAAIAAVDRFYNWIALQVFR
jgi:preprotein translocase subunit SecE